METKGKYFCIGLFLCIFTEVCLHAQNENFLVKRTSFSSHITDEFSPQLYKNGLVFCSNQGGKSIVSYGDNQKGLFKVFYVEKTKTGWTQPGLFASGLTASLNVGPVTFNSSGNMACFSRNNQIENSFANVNDTTNKLGLYFAELSGENWTHIRPFAYNDVNFNFSAPSLAPDESGMYFSSDRAGGYGGMDLYFSQFQNGTWMEPVNLGPLINTPQSESFPFASNDGKLFFSSDGHPGFGGKDIYYTEQVGGAWISPIHLDSAINSIADDFGLTTDSSFAKGYFSSNRMKTDDIFSFTLLQPAFLHCDTVKENNYCFTFYDERQQLIDTVPAIYSWDFGKGQILKGKEVKYCFPGAGEYTVKLTILDAIEGKKIANNVEYKVDLRDIEQFMIGSDNVGIVNQSLTFQAVQYGLYDFIPTKYFWNFGDGFRPGGPCEAKTFGRKGEYTVQVGIWGQKNSQGITPEKCFLKNVQIFDSQGEWPVTVKQDKIIQNKQAK